MKAYGLFGKFETKEENRESLVNILQEASKELASFDDCLMYQVSVSTNDTRSIYVYEVWKNEQAHTNSLELTAIQQLIQKGRPLIEKMETFASFYPLV